MDGVLLIGEHGDYADNEIGQKLYPRKELFDKIVDVFRTSNRSVPVFCDKHLSWNFDWALEMDRTAREMGFLLLAGSSIPHCLRPRARSGKRLQSTAVVMNIMDSTVSNSHKQSLNHAPAANAVYDRLPRGKVRKSGASLIKIAGQYSSWKQHLRPLKPLP